MGRRGRRKRSGSYCQFPPAVSGQAWTRVVLLRLLPETPPVTSMTLRHFPDTSLPFQITQVTHSTLILSISGLLIGRFPRRTLRHFHLGRRKTRFPLSLRWWHL